MSGRLKFKGEPKKKRKREKHDEGDRTVSTSDLTADVENEEGWIDLPTIKAAHGPLFIVHRLTTSCLAINANLYNRLYAHELLHAATQPETLREPNDLTHVWVATRIPESATRYTLRSSAGRFLACDEIGTVHADREARGMQEEWEFAETRQPGRFALRSVPYGTYIGVEEVAGGKLEVRGDSKDIGEHETWSVRMQARNRNEMAKRELAETRKAGEDDGLTIVKDVGVAEMDYIRKYQAPGEKGWATSKEDTRNLKQAKKDGRLHEEMLDRRMKVKSDRYC